MEEELRKQAIRRYVLGEAPRVIYTSMNRSKKWFFKWLKRYQSGVVDWHKDESKAPRKRPTKTGDYERDLIVSVRKHLDSEPFAQVGVSAIKWEMTKLGVAFPSDRTINRIVKAEGLVKKRVPMSPRELSIRISERLCASTASTKRILWVPATSSVTGSSTHST
jgi:hypothetical protein